LVYLGIFPRLEYSRAGIKRMNKAKM